MPENTWIPKNMISDTTEVVTVTAQDPVEMPPIGALMSLQLDAYGNARILPKNIQLDADLTVVVVEVKAIKKTKIVLE